MTLRNTFLINFGFKISGVDCWYCDRTDHFIVKDSKGYHLSYVFGPDLGVYSSQKAIEDFLK